MSIPALDPAIESFPGIPLSQTDDCFGCATCLVPPSAGSGAETPAFPPEFAPVVVELLPLALLLPTSDGLW